MLLSYVLDELNTETIVKHFATVTIQVRNADGSGQQITGKVQVADIDDPEKLAAEVKAFAEAQYAEHEASEPAPTTGTDLVGEPVVLVTEQELESQEMADAEAAEKLASTPAEEEPQE